MARDEHTQSWEFDLHRRNTGATDGANVRDGAPLPSATAAAVDEVHDGGGGSGDHQEL